jgi:uncharacterized protein YdaU (DUF1376 family)
MAGRRRAPAFQLYVDDFIAGTYMMTNEEVGAYIRLLCHQWSKMGVPPEPQMIARIVNERSISPDDFKEHFSEVLAKFDEGEDGFLRNSRLEKYRKEQNENYMKRVENSKKGGAANKARIDAIKSQKATQNGSLSDTRSDSLKGSKQGSRTDSQNGAPPTPTPTPYIKPSDGKGDSVALDIFKYMNECLRESGHETSYKKSKYRITLIEERLQEVEGDADGVKQAYKRMAYKWKGTRYADALQPDHFFRPEKFLSYYEHRHNSTGSTEEREALQAEINSIQAKFLNSEKTFESEHREADGTLKPESAERLKELKKKVGKNG